MQKKHLSFLSLSLFALFLSALLTSCHRGVTLHPSKLTPEVKKECASALSGLYDTSVRVVSTIAGTERVVKIEDGKRTEYFESQDSTLQLRTTVLDYDNEMKMILHGFPLSTLAPALPDSLGELRTAVAAQSEQELTIDYQFEYDSYSDQLFLTFEPQDLPFTCQTADGLQHHLRLSFRDDSRLLIGTLEDRVMNVNLVLDSRQWSFRAVTLYEDERPLFTFDDWEANDFYTIFMRFDGRS